MAGEIGITLKFTVTKGSTTATIDLGVDTPGNILSIDVTGGNILHNRQTVGTTEEALLLGDCGAGGYFIGVNRDSTNFIEIRQGTGIADLVRINAGEMACFRITDDATAPFVIADTGACELEYILVEK